MERYTIPALIIIVSLGIFFGFIRGTYAKIEQGIKQKEELVSYLEQAKNAKEKLDALSNAVKSFPPDAEKKLATMVPEKMDQVRFYMEFQELSRKSGMVFSEQNASMGQSKEGEGPVSNQMSFTVDATYPTFRKMLRVVEKSLALRELGSVSFSATRQGGYDTKGYRAPNPETDIFSYSLTITSYSMK